MRHVLAAGAPWGGGGSTQHSELHSRQQLKAFVMDVPDRHMLLIYEGIQNLLWTGLCTPHIWHKLFIMVGRTKVFGPLKHASMTSKVPSDNEQPTALWKDGQG